MDNNEFKVIFGNIAKAHGFERAFGGWFRESAECIVALDLQKSNYSDLYYLNIKIYIQGMFGNQYKKSKDLVKREIGNISLRQPKDFFYAFDFDTPMDDVLRLERFESLFSQYLDSFTDKVLSRSGIREMAEKGEVFLTTAVKKELKTRFND